MRSARAILLACVAAAGLAAAGCGKKGPPLVPLVQVPGRAMDLKARRTGSTVTLTFTIPSANIDDTRPADIRKVEVYAYTAVNQNDVREVRRMKLIKTIPVRKPPEPDAEQKPAGPARPVAAAPAPGEEQGSVVTVTETLDPGMLTPLAPDSKKAAAGGAKTAVAGRRVLEELSDISGPFGAPFGTPLAGPPPVAEVHRYYVVYGVSRSGNRGGASPRPPVSLPSRLPHCARCSRRAASRPID